METIETTETRGTTETTETTETMETITACIPDASFLLALHFVAHSQDYRSSTIGKFKRASRHSMICIPSQLLSVRRAHSYSVHFDYDSSAPARGSTAWHKCSQLNCTYVSSLLITIKESFPPFLRWSSLRQDSERGSAEERDRLLPTTNHISLLYQRFLCSEAHTSGPKP